jgi:hypothetical protein
MIRKQKFTILVRVALLTILLLAGATFRAAVPTVAQTSSSYDLKWHVIGGGGQPVASAGYLAYSTMGQGAASPPYSVSSSYAISGGYWYGDGLTVVYSIYLPLVVRAVP